MIHSEEILVIYECRISILKLFFLEGNRLNLKKKKTFKLTAAATKSRKPGAIVKLKGRWEGELFDYNSLAINESALNNSLVV